MSSNFLWGKELITTTFGLNIGYIPYICQEEKDARISLGGPILLILPRETADGEAGAAARHVL